jgi:hypothetical protein
MFEQVAIAVQNEEGYKKLHALIDAAFDPSQVEVFLDRVKRAKLRVRDYETILDRGFLGREADTLYAALPVSDQGLTRERYLWLVEKVPVELRQRYLKAYAYY